jgi:hypothetical protein
VKILQCHSQGDTRFSPFFCWLEAFGVRNSIENFYQTAKVFVDKDGSLIYPANWREAKFYEKELRLPLYLQIRLPNKQFLPAKYIIYGWYSSLWLKYLDLHPELVDIAKGYDDYEDKFKGNFPLCQADCIRLYCKQGRQALLAHCTDFFLYIRDRAKL